MSTNWLVIDIGCLECKVDTLVYGPFSFEDVARAQYEECQSASRKGGSRASLWKFEAGQYVEVRSPDSSLDED